MHLQLSPEEFERLLKLAYLGEAVQNDWVPAEETTDEQRATTDLLYDLCAEAKDTPCARLVTEDEASGEWLPSEELREEMHAALGAYDNDVFWDELVHRLAEKELVAEYGREALEGMPEGYRRQAELPVLEYYWEEVHRHGIDRFRLATDDAQKSRARQPRGRGPRSRPSPPKSPADETTTDSA